MLDFKGQRGRWTTHPATSALESHFKKFFALQLYICSGWISFFLSRHNAALLLRLGLGSKTTFTCRPPSTEQPQLISTCWNLEECDRKKKLFYIRRLFFFFHLFLFYSSVFSFRDFSTFSPALLISCRQIFSRLLNKSSLLLPFLLSSLCAMALDECVEFSFHCTADSSTVLVCCWTFVI